MKSAAVVLCALCGFAMGTNAQAEVLPKDVTSIKEAFDKVGATSCSESLARTVNFIAKGRPISHNKQWSTTETNKKPISLDFLVAGTKEDYSISGAIVLTPIGNRCVGNYVYSYVAPSENCKAYIHKAGFDGAEWQEDMTDPNGDGGTVYFLSVKANPSLNFIFNDVAGGCAMTKRETLELNANK